MQQIPLSLRTKAPLKGKCLFKAVSPHLGLPKCNSRLEHSLSGLRILHHIGCKPHCTGPFTRSVLTSRHQMVDILYRWRKLRHSEGVVTITWGEWSSDYHVGWGEGIWLPLNYLSSILIKGVKCMQSVNHTQHLTCKSCDLLVPGSPQRRMLISALKRPRPVFSKSFFVPPNSWSKIPFLISSFS